MGAQGQTRQASLQTPQSAFSLFHQRAWVRRGPVKLQDVKSDLAGYGGSCCQAGNTQEQWCGDGHRLWDLVQRREGDTEPAGWVGQRER